MKHVFGYDGVLGSFVNAITDVLCLSLLWLLFSIPVVTIGSASSALYYAVQKAFREDEGHPIRLFWQSFRANFKQTALLGLVYVPLAIALTISCWYGYAFYSAGSLQLGLLIAIVVFLAVVLTWGCYAFPYIARFEDRTNTVIINCIYLMLRRPVHSVLALAVLAGAAALIISVPLGLAAAPAICALAATFVLEPVFTPYIPKDSRLEVEAAE